MAIQAQTGFIATMMTKLSTFEGSRDFLAVTDWILKLKETIGLIIASKENISEKYIVRYAARLFKREVLIGG